MLIADGYMHSLKALLDKSSAEQARPAQRAHRAQLVRALVLRVTDRVARNRAWPGLSWKSTTPNHS